MPAKNSVTGLSKETSGALAYVLGPLTGIIFLILDKNPYVRFHAMQSIVVFTALFIADWVLLFSLVLSFLIPFIAIIGFILWLLLIYKAWLGSEFEVPVLGKITRQLLERV